MFSGPDIIELSDDFKNYFEIVIKDQIHKITKLFFARKLLLIQLNT